MSVLFNRLVPLAMRVVAVCVLPALAGCAALEKPAFEEQVKAEWKEFEWTLPPYPVDADLIPFRPSAEATAAFFVDGRSLRVDPDEVVRYTLVIRSAGGAENVSFEGMRCETAERKLFAIGRSKGDWVPSRNDAWQRISDNALNRHHALLFKEFFCLPGSILPSREDILRNLRAASRY
ncbi:CNP1-like family protein [Zoogloea sp.]|uniref:CNP1-like family protein n=1 Tax=Zoogloea sp. TaxID=49181 RepID=UPI0026127952|nr:CNP1-like family protein [Zoogloea sp.]MDD3354438.1 CNP1-like family protein [Zoogloea sp.]